MTVTQSLLSINVNDKTERKNGLTYLSWAWAWAEVLKIDPGATWMTHEYVSNRFNSDSTTTQPCMYLQNGTAMVKTTVKIKNIDRSCMLPVMDHRNKAIKDPDAFAINTAIMRCMTKAISMHGLGLYIYAGEDLPEGEEKPKPKGRDPSEAPIVSPDRLAIIQETALAINEAFERDSVIDAYGYYEEFTDEEERVALWKLLPSHIRSAIKKHGQSLKEQS